MLVGLERDYTARKQGVHLREDIQVTPDLFCIKPFHLINKQATKTLYNLTKFSFESEQKEAGLYSRVKLGLIAKIRKCVCVRTRACVQIQEGESDKKERLSSCLKVVKLSS